MLSVSADISDRVAFDGRVKMTVTPRITVRSKPKQHGSDNNISDLRSWEILDISEDWGSRQSDANGVLAFPEGMSEIRQQLEQLPRVSQFRACSFLRSSKTKRGQHLTDDDFRLMSRSHSHGDGKQLNLKIVILQGCPSFHGSCLSAT